MQGEKLLLAYLNSGILSYSQKYMFFLRICRIFERLTLAPLRSSTTLQHWTVNNKEQCSTSHPLRIMIATVCILCVLCAGNKLPLRNGKYTASKCYLFKHSRNVFQQTI